MGTYNGREERDADVTTGGHNAPGTGGSKGGGGGGSGVSMGPGPRGANLNNTSPITHDALGRVNDYNNVGNDFLDRVGNFLAGQLGLNEIDPIASNVEALKSGQRPGTNADWGFDPAGLMGSAVGMAFGVPLVGTATDWVSKKLGRPLEMNLGPSVFGSPDSPGTSTGGGLGSLMGGGGWNGPANAPGTPGRGGNREPDIHQALALSALLGHGLGRGAGPADGNPKPGGPGQQPPGGGQPQTPYDPISQFPYGHPEWFGLPATGMASGGLAALPRQGTGPVRGPGSVKDDLVGPIMLSNREYVLPYEMVKMAGGGNYKAGVDALEKVRRVALRK